MLAVRLYRHFDVVEIQSKVTEHLNWTLQKFRDNCLAVELLASSVEALVCYLVFVSKSAEVPAEIHFTYINNLCSCDCVH